MHLLTEAIEQLAQDELGTGIDMNARLGNVELLREKAAQRRRIGLRVIVAEGQLRLRGGDCFD